MRMIDKKIINTGRQFEVDVAKAFAVFFMIVVHVFEHTVQPPHPPLKRSPLPSRGGQGFGSF